MPDFSLLETIQRNCAISDARDSGVFSLCSLILKLRNLYKWEEHVEPWEEPEPAVVLDWISEREEFWESIKDEQYHPLPIDGRLVDPFDVETVNAHLADRNFMYGAGYGRSLKSVFFLAEVLVRKSVDQKPVVVLGREKARELSGLPAMVQDGTIIIRREQVRFFLCDQINELLPAAKKSLQHALGLYGLLGNDGLLDRQSLIEKLDHMVDEEIPTFIYHELGELQEQPLASATLKQIIATFPGSLIEFLTRAIKDVLADTHARGLLGHIVAEKNEASLALYISFLGGLRKLLCPEIGEAFFSFLETGDWMLIEQARTTCRRVTGRRAETLTALCAELASESPQKVRKNVERELLAPLGLGPP
ncbi:hypothetical protein BMS3Bbin14_01450 [bacterium BMS3Bbin14]|nr:hypothetical protein BMS3Abin13_00674 [bacterium BMS3Abin13]GBE52970.1 hypothetical protein BMS3Bbin14_01450 [bacterium BMS3Bbin14]HDL98163.1 hypothetical protein [Desulfobacteraceae bacterium]HDO30114.1 hypothetical protein [Desulfobacteraceae bacterium]